MTIEEFFANFFIVSPLIIVKVFAVALLLLHVFFSVVILRQTQLMTKMIEVKIAPVIFAASVIHLLASLFVLFWAILFL